MFYFKITVQRKQREPKIAYHEFTKPIYAGEYIAARLTNPAVKSATASRRSARSPICGRRGGASDGAAR
jgi:hypothetical protein